MIGTPVFDSNARHPAATADSADLAPLDISPLLPEDMAAVTAMTFPAFRPLLASCLAGEAHDGRFEVALVARTGGVPVGLVLAQLPLPTEANKDDPERHKTARLLSVFVVPAWQRHRVATRLLWSLEEALSKRACARLTTGYTTRMPAWQPLEKLLAACRWPAPETTLLMSMGLVDQVMNAPWLAAPREAPAGFELFEWSQLGIEERAQLQREVDGGDIPEGLSPFDDEEFIEAAISVGVRHNGEVVAWMIVTCSPFIIEALCYRSQYVRPQLRVAQALGPLMLAEALCRHAASPIKEARPVGVFGISFKSATKMINFFRKRLAPYCFSTYESRADCKTLVI